jgi:integrase
MCQPPDMSEARARDKARRLSERAAKEALPGVTPKRGANGVAVVSSEPLAAWCERWCSSREERGLSTVTDDRGRLRKWVLPRFKGVAIQDVRREDLERLVEKLDAATRAGELHWKTARNVWGVVTRMFDDACRSKTLALRVLSVNPSAGVRGPDRGGDKSKAYLFPAEFSALVSCAAVPVTWRRVYAITTYLYLRAAEARGLDWRDVDLDHGVVLVHQTRTAGGRIGATKTKAPRRVAIEAALLPLLRAMRAEAPDGGPVLPHMPVEKHLPPMLRRHLEAAGVTRADLFAEDETRKRLRFHDLRATGLTWMAVRGDNPHAIKQRAGHTTFSTTEGYIREAESVREGFGEPFPALPEAIVSPGESPERVGANGHVYRIVQKNLVGEAGFEDVRTRTDPLVSKGFLNVEPEPSTPNPTPNLAMSRAPGESRAKPEGALDLGPASAPATPTSPRAALLAHLSSDMTAALAVGDVEAARVAHEAIGRLLGAAPRVGDAAATVVDLEAERERRGVR